MRTEFRFSAIIVASKLPISYPNLRTCWYASFNKILESAPLYFGSSSGKNLPMSPRETAPKIASVIAWSNTSASLCPSNPLSCPSSMPPMIKGRPSTNWCTSYPYQFSSNPSFLQYCFRKEHIFRRCNLNIIIITFNDVNWVQPFNKRRIVST